VCAMGTMTALRPDRLRALTTHRLVAYGGLLVRLLSVCKMPASQAGCVMSVRMEAMLSPFMAMFMIPVGFSAMERGPRGRPGGAGAGGEPAGRGGWSVEVELEEGVVRRSQIGGGEPPAQGRADGVEFTTDRR